MPSRRVAVTKGGPIGAGPTSTPGSRSGRPTRAVALADHHYLWILVLLELGTLAWLRAHFKGVHGG